jgi:hypothetical protein
MFRFQSLQLTLKRRYLILVIIGWMPEVQTPKDKEILLYGGLVRKDDARVGRGPPKP